MNLAQHSLIFAVRLYQWAVSPLLSAISGPAGQCRFTPSCSHYAEEAVREHGAVKGGALAVWRVCRCHPWGGCGEDRVPRRVQSSSSFATATEDRSFKVQSLTEPEANGLKAVAGGRG